MERRLGFPGLGRRKERTRLELPVVAEAPLKPDPELAPHAELMKRLAMVALPVVDSVVPDAAQVVKERPLRRSDDLSVPEPVDELLLPRLGTDEEPDFRRGALREHFAELAQLEERHGGVVPEVLLGLRREGDEARVVMREVGEVRRRVRGHGGSERDAWRFRS